MRRADRLFKIIQLLRGRRRAVTAAELAKKLEVSERTVYRDVRDLVASGTPIQGEAGVGYSLHREYDLPPLMFDEDEIEALVLGARIVAANADEVLARAAMSVVSKVEAVLPKGLEDRIAKTALYAPIRRVSGEVSDALVWVRTATSEQRRLVFAYEDEGGRASERIVRPLGAFFWGRSWTVAAWCELRADFRNFRLDRMASIELGDAFEPEDGQSLHDYLMQYGPAAVRMLER